VQVEQRKWIERQFDSKLFGVNMEVQDVLF